MASPQLFCFVGWHYEGSAMVDGAAVYEIRVARPVDTDAVSTLLVASYSSLLIGWYDSDTLRRALPQLTKANPTLLASSTYYVAECAAGELVGCGGWTTARPGSGEIIEEEAHLRHFAVRPDQARRGIGTALLLRCLSEAQRLGIRTVHCLSTLNAEPFYRASGFDAIGPISVDMGPPALTFPGALMRCKL
jgi:N-acetylglutamate synthase-like GNAT family acetyltransferase